MIVALRAPNGHAHERRGDDLERLGHDLVLGCGGVRAGAGAVGCHPQKTGRGELVDLFRIQAGVRRRNHFIAGELFADKPIPRHVVVERADDVVAIAPCPAPLGVALGVALRVGVPGDVEPVASPALAVIWRSQQAIDQLVVGLRRFVGEKFRDLFRGGRQSGEVERRAPDERAFAGLRRETKSVGIQSAQQEGVDRIGRAAGHGRIFDRLKRPETALLTGDPFVGTVRLGAGSLGPLLNPSADGLDFRSRQLGLLLGHLAISNFCVEQALLRLARRDRRAVFAALEQQLAQAHVEPALGRAVLAVAVETMRLENRPHIRLECDRGRLARIEHKPNGHQPGDSFLEKSTH